MADIFISYARADRERVEKLAAGLEGEGYSVWWDRHIEGGAEFSKEIERELDGAKAVIVAWSNQSIESRWVKDEAVAAADAGKLIPISIDGAKAPMGFRQFHLIDLSGWKNDSADEAFQDVSRAVKSRLTGEAQVVPAPSKASWTDKLLKPIPLAALGVAVGLLVGVITMNREPVSSFETRSTNAPQDEGSVSRIASQDEGSDNIANPHPEEAQRAVAKDSDDTQTIPEKSIAVLPFADMSESGDQEYFSDGMAEEILNALVKVPDLRVVGRTSSFSFKGKNIELTAIGAALNVSHILEGSVRKQGNRVRITAQLIKADDGFHLWSETYDGTLDNILICRKKSPAPSPVS